MGYYCSNAAHKVRPASFPDNETLNSVGTLRGMLTSVEYSTLGAVEYADPHSVTRSWDRNTLVTATSVTVPGATLV